MATFVVCQIYIFPSSKHEIMTKMTKNENNDSFMRDKNIMRAVDGKRKSHFAWPNESISLLVVDLFIENNENGGLTMVCLRMSYKRK